MKSVLVRVMHNIFMRKKWQKEMNQVIKNDHNSVQDMLTKESRAPTPTNPGYFTKR